MKAFSYIIYLFFITLLVSEVGLRIAGFKPDVFQNFDGFEIVDSLYEFKNYTTDEYGIYKFSSYITDSVTNNLDATTYSRDVYLADRLNDENLKHQIDWGTDHVGEVFTDFLELARLLDNNALGNKYEDNEFVRYLKAIALQDSISDRDSLILKYIQKPFNNEGFRGVDFTQVNTGKKRILLVGDSFTYGQTAKPFFYSFADLLLARGYTVFNAGISGTDPAQYAAIVEKYVPILSPDIVLINFCLNNDLMSFDREPHQNRPHEYLTNAGFFYSSPSGEFYLVDEAYEYYKTLSTIPNSESSFINSIISKFAVTTQIWGLMYKLGLVKHPILDGFYNSRNTGDEMRGNITSKYIDKMILDGDYYDIPIKFILIPDVAYQPEDFTNLVIYDSLVYSVFENYEYFFPAHFQIDDFAEGGDIHFNNKGHLKYTNYLDSLITNYFDKEL